MHYDTTAETDRIRQVERSRLDALVAGDLNLADPLHASDFQLVTPIGALLGKEQYLGAIAAGQISYVSWEPGPIDVRLSGSVASIRYKARLEVIFGGHRVAPASYWHTDSYELNDGAWQAVWSQATEIR